MAIKLPKMPTYPLQPFIIARSPTCPPFFLHYQVGHPTTSKYRIKLKAMTDCGAEHVAAFAIADLSKK
jgi:DNA-directed RNA polymerase subunit L